MVGTILDSWRGGVYLGQKIGRVHQQHFISAHPPYLCRGFRIFSPMGPKKAKKSIKLLAFWSTFFWTFSFVSRKMELTKPISHAWRAFLTVFEGCVEQNMYFCTFSCRCGGDSALRTWRTTITTRTIIGWLVPKIVAPLGWLVTQVIILQITMRRHHV